MRQAAPSYGVVPLVEWVLTTSADYLTTLTNSISTDTHAAGAPAGSTRPSRMCLDPSWQVCLWGRWDRFEKEQNGSRCGWNEAALKPGGGLNGEGRADWIWERNGSSDSSGC